MKQECGEMVARACWPVWAVQSDGLVGGPMTCAGECWPLPCRLAHCTVQTNGRVGALHVALVEV